MSETLMQSALPTAVNRQERRKVHLPLTCIIFDPMVHPCFSAGNERKYSLTRFLNSSKYAT